MALDYTTFFTLAIAQLIFLAGYFLIHHTKMLVAKLISLLCISFICYLLAISPGDMFDTLPLATFIFYRLGTLSTILLWLVSYFLFVDKHEIKPIFWVSAGYYFVARFIAGLTPFTDFTLTPVTFLFTLVIPELIKIGFLAHAIYLITKGFDTDLSVSRRKLRIGFISSIAVLLIIVIGNSSFLVFTSFIESTTSISDSTFAINIFTNSPIPPVFYSIYIYLVALVFMLWKFEISEKDAVTILGLSDVQKDNTSDALQLKSEQQMVIDKIRHAMEVDKIYRKHKLTVSELADHISSREYKVRVAINNHMNYRNFSEFLNSYRITEAAERLRSNEENISYIGLDVGYISLSSFHKAFKEKYNATPKEFRLKNQLTTAK